MTSNYRLTATILLDDIHSLEDRVMPVTSPWTVNIEDLALLHGVLRPLSTTVEMVHAETGVEFGRIDFRGEWPTSAFEHHNEEE